MMNLFDQYPQLRGYRDLIVAVLVPGGVIGVLVFIAFPLFSGSMGVGRVAKTFDACIIELNMKTQSRGEADVYVGVPVIKAPDDNKVEVKDAPYFGGITPGRSIVVAMIKRDNGSVTYRFRSFSGPEKDDACGAIPNSFE